MSERLNLRLKQALNDDAASKELIAFLEALDPDGDGAVDADSVVYDNSGSGLTATDVQAAVDEVEDRVDTLEATVDTVGATPAGTGVTATEVPGTRKLVFTFVNTPVPMVDEAGVVAYGSVKIADLPAGAIQLLGATGNLAVTKDAAGVNDDWDGDWSLGSVAADNNATLSGTEADMVPSTPTPQAVAGATTATGQSTATEAPAIFDGTTTPVPVHLNFLVDDVDHDVTTTPTNLLLNGTLTLVYAELGDY